MVERSGLVPSRSCQNQEPIWQRRGFLVLVPPLSFSLEGETEEICGCMEELLFSSQLKGGMKAFFAHMCDLPRVGNLLVRSP